MLQNRKVSVQIRPVGESHLARLQAVEDAADSLLVELLRPQRWDPAPTGAERAAEPGFIFVAYETLEQHVVGFVHVLEIDGLAHLEQASVLPTHGRRGYGRRLVEAAVAEARRRGYDRITLRTFAEVPWNAPFYASCGFAETEPATAFHRRLVETERRLGLTAYGRRVQMTRIL